MKNLFLAASGSLAVVPGFATLLAGVGYPPGLGMLFAGCVEAFGGLALLLIWANRQRLIALRRRTVVLVAVAMAIVALACIITYYAVFEHCVVVSLKEIQKGYGAVYFPLWLQGDMAKLVTEEAHGSRVEALHLFGPQKIAEKLTEMPGYGFAWLITTVVLVFLYQALFTSLTIAFGMAALHADCQQDLGGNQFMDNNALRELQTMVAQTQLPEETKRAFAEKIQRAQTPLETDPWIYRMVVGAIGLAILACLLFTFVLVLVQDKDTVAKTPEIFMAIGSASVGALAGLLAPSPVTRHQQ